MEGQAPMLVSWPNKLNASLSAICDIAPGVYNTNLGLGSLFTKAMDYLLL